MDDPPDEKQDIRQFNVVLQLPEGGIASSPDWRSEIQIKKDEGVLHMMDLNNDNIDDVYGVVDKRITVFINKGGRFDFKKPDQIMKFSADEIFPLLKDIDSDGDLDLFLSNISFETSIVNLQSAAIQNLCIFLSSIFVNSIN